MKPLYGFLIWFRPFSAYALIAWLVIILIVSSIPSIPTLNIHTGRGDIRLDNLIHICEYGLLASLSYLSLTGAVLRSITENSSWLPQELFFLQLPMSSIIILSPDGSSVIKILLPT